MFSGSYLPNDVTFLLKEISIPSTSIEDKEKNIQKNNQHYSQMVTFEKKPEDAYMDIFYKSIELNGDKFSQHCCTLAKQIYADYQNEKEIVIVSLARAGTPIGVLVKKYIEDILLKPTTHYCISIIRDVGIDYNALSFILQHHKDSSIVFIDGWTGKGVIGKQLEQSISQYNLQNNSSISSSLYVVADISGTAYYSATHEDYLLPSSVLNSTISGLVSRTIYNETYLSPKDFHGCVIYEHLRSSDISQWFIDVIFEKMSNIDSLNDIIMTSHIIQDLSYKTLLQQKSFDTLAFFKTILNIDNVNFIKPGIGEATRVMLRRMPKELWVKNIDAESTKHLIFLAYNKEIPIYIKEDMVYQSVAIIQELD